MARTMRKVWSKRKISRGLNREQASSFFPGQSPTFITTEVKASEMETTIRAPAATTMPEWLPVQHWTVGYDLRKALVDDARLELVWQSKTLSASPSTETNRTLPIVAAKNLHNIFKKYKI